MADELGSDVDPKKVNNAAVTDMATRVQRAKVAQQAQAAADLNQRRPTPQYDEKTKRRFYETAPVPLRRLLGSPLAQTGKYAAGPNRERRIASGWGAARDYSYGKGGLSSIHMGLDFAAPYGEAVLACGDGKVTFVGFQRKAGGGLQVPGVSAKSNGNILDGAGVEIANYKDVGHGGVIIFIALTGDFAGYTVEFHHLSTTSVKVGDRVSEGQVIGAVGTSGYPWSAPHLHFQVAFGSGGARALVNPTALVPNYFPGRTDSTNSADARGIQLPPLATAGMQATNAQVANAINGLNRATSLQNQSVADARQRMSDHAGVIGGVLGVYETVLHGGNAAFQGAAPVVAAPMTFDFTTGTWSDGKPV